jgi:hypothetical protein
VIALIIFVSVLPILIEVYRHRRAGRTADPASKR